MKIDWWYYAIKGFIYQIDKTILEILNNPNSEVNFEQIQDINFKDIVIQVKHKEQAKYSDSLVKKPIIQLFDLFQQDQTKHYHLYAYFSDKEEETKNLTLDELNIILGKNDFNDALKKKFLSVFTFKFSKNFNEHFKNVIEKIKIELSCSSDEEALLAHGVILDHLLKKIANNSKKDIKERKSSKSELQNILSNNKSCIFYSAYKDFLWTEKYFKFIKSRFIKPKNQNSENLIYLGEIKKDHSVTLNSLIYKITEKYFEKASYTIKPIVFIVSDSEILNIKKYLIDKNVIFNDGFEYLKFNHKLFLRNALYTRKKVGKSAWESIEEIEFKIRILSKTVFKQISEKNYSPDMIYYFDIENLNVFSNKPYIKIDGLNSKQILQLFNS